MTCVVIDDMIDTAGTITKAVDALFNEGAKDVIIAATHGVYSFTPEDHAGLDKRARVLIKIVDGKWTLLP